MNKERFGDRLAGRWEEHLADLDARNSASDTSTLLTAEQRQAMREKAAKFAASSVLKHMILRALDSDEAREQQAIDDAQQLEVLRPGGTYAWKSKCEIAERERDEARAEIARLQHDVGTLRHQLCEAQAEIARREGVTMWPPSDDAEKPYAENPPHGPVSEQFMRHHYGANGAKRSE